MPKIRGPVKCNWLHISPGGSWPCQSFWPWFQIYVFIKRSPNQKRNTSLFIECYPATHLTSSPSSRYEIKSYFNLKIPLLYPNALCSTISHQKKSRIGLYLSMGGKNGDFDQFWSFLLEEVFNYKRKNWKFFRATSDQRSINISFYSFKKELFHVKICHIY